MKVTRGGSLSPLGWIIWPIRDVYEWFILRRIDREKGILGLELEQPLLTDIYQMVPGPEGKGRWCLHLITGSRNDKTTRVIFRGETL